MYTIQRNEVLGKEWAHLTKYKSLAMDLLRSESDWHVWWICRGRGSTPPLFPSSLGLPPFPTIHETGRRCAPSLIQRILTRIPRSPATCSTAAHTLDTWCPIWRPQVGHLARTQGIYF